MDTKKTSIEDLVFISYPVKKDKRGSIGEVFRAHQFNEFMPFSVALITHTISKERVLRGLHAHSCGRVIYPVTGKIFAVFVDIRENSETFGKVVTTVLSGRKSVYIPPYVANSFYVCKGEISHYLYICDAYYENQIVKSIAWNDPKLKIKWPDRFPILSKRDKKNPFVKTYDKTE